MSCSLTVFVLWNLGCHSFRHENCKLWYAISIWEYGYSIITVYGTLTYCCHWIITPPVANIHSLPTYTFPTYCSVLHDFDMLFVSYVHFYSHFTLFKSQGSQWNSFFIHQNLTDNLLFSWFSLTCWVKIFIVFVFNV